MRNSWKPGLAIAIAIAVVIGLFVIAEVSRARLRDAAEEVRQAQQRSILVTDLQQIVTDAEAAERGFILTGDDRYLEPLSYAAARIKQVADQLTETYRTATPNIGRSVRKLRYLAGVKMGQMSAMVALYRGDGAAAAHEQMRTVPERETMTEFRALARAVLQHEAGINTRATARWEREVALVRRLNFATLLTSVGLSALAGLLILRSLGQQAAVAADLSRRRDELQTEADARAAELTDLYRHLQTVQEEERARLSRGLHDELGGLLLVARMDVTWLQQHREADPGVLAERLTRIRKAIDRGIDLKRRVVEELRPTLLDNLGLVAALRWQIEETCARGSVRCRDHFPDEEPRLTRSAAIALFRVVQEALLNVVRHAKASEAEVHLEITDDSLLLVVRDNGVGLQPTEVSGSRAHGLAGMRQRVVMLGGQMAIGRPPGGGTEIRITVPLEEVLDPARIDDEIAYPVLPRAGDRP